MLNAVIVPVITGVIALIAIFQYGYRYNQSPISKSVEIVEITTSSPTSTSKPSPLPTLTPTPKAVPIPTIKPTSTYQYDNSLEFNGYECTDDCSGHEAGYDWAEENGITQDDVDNYSGNSNSFMEGMQSYVDENY